MIRTRKPPRPLLQFLESIVDGFHIRVLGTVSVRCSVYPRNVRAEQTQSTKLLL